MVAVVGLRGLHIFKLYISLNSSTITHLLIYFSTGHQANDYRQARWERDKEGESNILLKYLMKSCPWHEQASSAGRENSWETLFQLRSENGIFRRILPLLPFQPYICYPGWTCYLPLSELDRQPSLSNS